MSWLRYELIHKDCCGILEERLTGEQVCLHLRTASYLWEGQMSPNLFSAEACACPEWQVSCLISTLSITVRTLLHNRWHLATSLSTWGFPGCLMVTYYIPAPIDLLRILEWKLGWFPLPFPCKTHTPLREITSGEEDPTPLPASVVSEHALALHTSVHSQCLLLYGLKEPWVASLCLLQWYLSLGLTPTLMSMLWGLPWLKCMIPSNISQSHHQSPWGHIPKSCVRTGACLFGDLYLTTAESFHTSRE